MADAKRLAKNTLFMYARMLVIMFVSIFTSRVVLDKLGIDDYGLYNAVASIVAMISFLNVTLSTSTSRYLTYDLGKGDLDKLRLTFSTSFYTHLFLAGIVVIIMETAGLWYMGNKFVVPEGRDFATQVVFQISIFTAAISVIEVPFKASIMSHEDLDIYAFIGLFEVFAKLGIVYLLSISTIDKLILYAILIAGVHFTVTSSYILTCIKKYKEINIKGRFNKETFEGMLGFTGWTAIANMSNTMVVQGATLLLNLFFSPAVIASKALANQITHAIMGFVSNFRVALNPQIIKSYASGNIDSFRSFTLRSTVVSFDLMLVLGLPCIVAMKTILKLWLVEVPEGAVAFSQLAILSQIINTISTSTYIPFVASGKLKLNALWGTVAGFGYFMLLYVVFKFGGGALWAQWMFLILCVISVLVLRPILLHKELGFTYNEMIVCGMRCFKALFASGFTSFFFYRVLGEDLLQQAILFFLVFIVSLVFSWLFMERVMREYLLQIIKSKLRHTK